jgi:hypothetical protein
LYRIFFCLNRSSPKTTRLARKFLAVDDSIFFLSASWPGKSRLAGYLYRLNHHCMPLRLFFWCMLACGPQFAWAQSVAELVLCQGVSNNKPVGVTQQFAQQARAYCWLSLEEATPGSTIEVAWYWQGDRQHVESLVLRGDSWRTHCYKTLYQAGTWRVVVRNQVGDSLAGETFTAGLPAMLRQGENGQARGAPSPPIPSPGMPIPAALPVPTESSQALVQPGQLLFPPDYDPNQAHPLLVFFPSVQRDAASWYQALHTHASGKQASFWDEYFPEETPTLSPLILLLPGSLAAQDQSWEGLATSIYRYENRLFADLSDLQTQAEETDRQVLLLGEGLGGDLAWAIAQRYPDRFAGALLLDCRCSYYQRGSLAIQAQQDMRYLLAHGPMDDIETVDNLRQSLKQLTDAQVPFQYWELAQPAAAGLGASRLQQGFEFLLTPTKDTGQ